MSAIINRNLFNRSPLFSLRLLHSCVVFLLAVLGGQSAWAQADTGTSPSAGALSDSPWYDSDTGIVPVDMRPKPDDSMNRQSRWLPKADRVRRQSTTATSNVNTGAGGGMLGTNLTLGHLFGWILLSLLIVALVGLVVYAFSKAEIEFSSNKTSVAEVVEKDIDQQTLERMKHLPAELRGVGVNMRSEAERLMQEQHFDQAIILLFGHQLLMLDKAGMLRLTRGKTNGRYVRETRSVDPSAAKRLRATATAFERSYFGHHKITAQEFKLLWENNLTLERQIDEHQGVAA